MTGKARRRWFGAMCLLAAVLMLFAGKTTPGERLAGLGFVIYWLACLIFTALALLTAILDARALRHEARAEQRALLEKTLEGIQSEKDRRPKRRPPNLSSPNSPPPR